MVKKCIFFLFALTQVHASLLDWFDPLSDKAKRAKELMEGFDEIAENAIKDYNVPGVAIGVVVDGHLIYAKGFGYRDAEKKLSVTADTLFAIASCTKAFTSFAAGMLVDEGLLNWDQLVIDVLPEFRLYDQYATQNLTIRDLLTHRTGMPRHDFMWYNSTMTRAELVKRIRYLEPSCNLRSRYQYGNLMYFTAGYAMEQITGKTWEEFVQEKILKPLDMHRTNFSVRKMEQDRDFSYPYIEKGNECNRMALRDISLCGPACSINSSVNELAHWVQMQLNGGTYKDRSLISLATLQEMHTPQVIVPGAPEAQENYLKAYGIGWGISSYRCQYILSHDGASEGFTSVIGILPYQGVGVIVLSNRNISSLPRFLSLQIIDRVLELPYIDWIQEGFDKIVKSKESHKEEKAREDLLRKKGTSPSHSLESFVGEYEHPGYGIVSIELADDKLQATFNGITCLLDHWHYDVFVISEETQYTFISREGTKISFQNNIKGEIEELIIPLEPAAGDIVFKRKAEAAHSTLSYLRQFTGIFEIYGYTVETVIRNNALCAIIPGQPLYELIPSGAENEFIVKSMTGCIVRFVLDSEGKIEEVLLVQPYGAFSAKPKNRD